MSSVISPLTSSLTERVKQDAASWLGTFHTAHLKAISHACTLVGYLIAKLAPKAANMRTDTSAVSLCKRLLLLLLLLLSHITAMVDWAQKTKLHTHSSALQGCLQTSSLMVLMKLVVCPLWNPKPSDASGFSFSEFQTFLMHIWVTLD